MSLHKFKNMLLFTLQVIVAFAPVRAAHRGLRIPCHCSNFYNERQIKQPDGAVILPRFLDGGDIPSIE